MYVFPIATGPSRVLVLTKMDWLDRLGMRPTPGTAVVCHPTRWTPEQVGALRRLFDFDQPKPWLFLGDLSRSAFVSFLDLRGAGAPIEYGAVWDEWLPEIEAARNVLPREDTLPTRALLQRLERHGVALGQHAKTFLANSECHLEAVTAPMLSLTSAYVETADSAPASGLRQSTLRWQPARTREVLLVARDASDLRGSGVPPRSVDAAILPPTCGASTLDVLRLLVSGASYRKALLVGPTDACLEAVSSILDRAWPQTRHESWTRPLRTLAR